MIYKRTYFRRLIVLFILHLSVVTGRIKSDYGALYACDGTTLKLECREGYVINLIRANYGRYSITVCNENGSPDLNVNCMSVSSAPILQTRCNAKQNCSVPASTNLFDDPCPGTVKYLEAHFTCVSVASAPSTARSSPVWFTTSSPSIWITSKFTIASDILSAPTTVPSTERTTTTSSKYDVEDDFEPASHNVPSIPEISSENVPVYDTYSTKYEPFSSTVNPNDDNYDGNVANERPFCKPITSRSINWKQTAAGVNEIQQCPGGATGFAKWECKLTYDNSAVRYPDYPDLSECHSWWINNLEDRSRSAESLLKTVKELASVTSSKMLYGGDIDTTAKAIHNFAIKMGKNLNSLGDQNQREAMVNDLLLDVTIIGSSMLNIDKQETWNDLSVKDQLRLATVLLVGLEESAFLMADTVVSETAVTHCMKNLLLSVQVIESKNVEDERFPSYKMTENCVRRINDWLVLPKSALYNNSANGLVRLVFMAFENLDLILKIFPNENNAKKINSKVIAASLGQGRHIQLKEPVTLCLQHLQTKNVSNPTCVFWDYTQNLWSEEGCSLVDTNETHSICQCDHLTNFAILSDVTVSAVGSRGESLSLVLICIIIVLVLLLIVAVYLAYRYRSQKEAANRKNYDSTFVRESRWLPRYMLCCEASEDSVEKSYSCKDARPSTAGLYPGGSGTMQSMASISNDGGGGTRTTHFVPPRCSNTIPRSYMADGRLEGHYSSGEGSRPSHNYQTYQRSGGGTRKMKDARHQEHLAHMQQHRRNMSPTSGGTNSTVRSTSSRSRSHTYNDVMAAAAAAAAGGGNMRPDPVYEEIGREYGGGSSTSGGVEHFSQVSDLSDDDPRREFAVDPTINRMWVRNYGAGGDNRPLIPFNHGASADIPIPERNFHAAMDAVYRQQVRDPNAARTISVLDDGTTVLCHMPPQQQQQQQQQGRVYHHQTVSRLPHY